jgi:hypothetical protein
VYDYDPQLLKSAQQSRAKNPVAKDKTHPYDRLNQKTAIGVATGALPVIYDGSTGDRLRGPFSDDYADIPVRYARSAAANRVRSYYAIRPAEEVFGPTDTEFKAGSHCVVVLAETNKDHEAKVLLRMKGLRDVRSIRSNRTDDGIK